MAKVKEMEAVVTSELMANVTKIDVVLTFLAELVFDRFVDHSKTQRPPEQKLYLSDGNIVVLPPGSIDSFLFRKQPPTGCAVRFEEKKGNDYRGVGSANVSIQPALIPILRNGKPIVFEDFGKNGFSVLHGSGIAKGTKMLDNPRAMLSLPLSVEFTLAIFKNPLIDEAKLHNWFDIGGIQIALGNWRPQHGRFAVTKWEVK